MDTCEIQQHAVCICRSEPCGHCDMSRAINVFVVYCDEFDRSRHTNL